MKMRAWMLGFTTTLSLCFSLTSTGAHADPRFNYFPIQEKMPDGRVHFRVIEEDPLLRADQNQISQRVIFNSIIPANEIPKDLSAFVSNVLKQMPSDQIGARAFPRTGKPLWTAAKNAWTQADEDAYSAWFASIDTSYNTNSGLPADCADTGLLFRWTYARAHLLPIANTLIGGKLFGHFSGSNAWDALPTNADWKKDERFKAAMKYLFNHTYTRTIVQDIYPTIVSPQYVRPGSMFMIIRPRDGHTQTIHQIDQADGITTYWGNEPAAAQVYSDVIDIELENKQTIGLWREVRLNASGEWELTPSAQMPGYSLAQFQQNFDDSLGYEIWLYQQLGITASNQTLLAEAFSSYYQKIARRLDLTAGSVSSCVKTQCAPNGSDYNNESTFALDAKIVSEQNQIARLFQVMGDQDPSVQYYQQYLQSLGEIVFGSGLTYLGLIQNPALVTNLNADPRVPYLARWGLTATAPNPTLNYFADAQVLLTLLHQRTITVYSGNSLCQNGCDPNSAAVKDNVKKAASPHGNHC